MLTFALASMIPSGLSTLTLMTFPSMVLAKTRVLSAEMPIDSLTVLPPGPTARSFLRSLHQDRSFSCPEQPRTPCYSRRPEHTRQAIAYGCCTRCTSPILYYPSQYQLRTDDCSMYRRSAC